MSLLIFLPLGHNRTGFMVCSYLITRLKYSVVDAVSTFKSCREPFGLYREDMVDELYEKYGDGAKREGAIEQPPWFQE